ncbi:hypothetical protein DITRI_Ditri10aG0076500 [Diplodiscus trichospermus]
MVNVNDYLSPQQMFVWTKPIDNCQSHGQSQVANQEKDKAKTFADVVSMTSRLNVCQHSLIGRVIMSKGDKPWTLTGLKELLLDVWKEPQVLSNIARAIGVPFKIDKATLLGDFRHFARILVDVDIKNLLLEKLQLEFNGVCFFVTFEFERLSTFCSTCSSVGHVPMDFYHNRKKDEVDRSKDQKEDVVNKQLEPLQHNQSSSLPNNEVNVQNANAQDAVQNSSEDVIQEVDKDAKRDNWCDIVSDKEGDSDVPSGQEEVDDQNNNLNATTKEGEEYVSSTFNFNKGGDVEGGVANLETQLVLKDMLYRYKPDVLALIEPMCEVEKVPQKRKELWHSLGALDITDPWLLMGDFNATVGVYETTRRLNDVSLDDIRQAIERNNLLEIDMRGSKFTWSAPCRGHLILSKLDRKLHDIQLRIVDKRPSDLVLEEESRIAAQLDTALSYQESLLSEYSRLNWLKEGDQNT